MASHIPASPLDYAPSRKFINLPDAIGAVDATLIEVCKPTDTEENKEYYSGKHCRHGGKVQVLVVPNGMCIHVSDVIIGLHHDYFLYKRSSLEEVLTKGQNKKKCSKILADGCYLGMVQSYGNVFIPVRKQKGGTLTHAQKEFNRLLSQDRSVVERCFGRLKLYWGIMRGPYRSDRTTLDTLVKICVCLANLKIRNTPLFANKDSIAEEAKNNLSEPPTVRDSVYSQDDEIKPPPSKIHRCKLLIKVHIPRCREKENSKRLISSLVFISS